jgi:anti-anti-sigma factor
MEIELLPIATIVRLGAEYSAFQESMLNETEEEIIRVLDDANTANLILDFQRTAYFGSVFFEVLFRLWKRTHAAGGQFFLCSLHPDCREILETARLTTLWDILPDVASCLSQMQANESLPIRATS